MRTIVKIFLWGVLGSPLYGQSFEQDMAAMKAAYNDVASLYVEMENSVWQNQKMGRQQKARISKKGELYLYEMEEATMLINKKYILMINHSTKTIVCNPWTKEKAKQLAKQHIPTATDLKAKYPSITYLGEQEQYKKYQLDNKDLQMSRIEVSFEPSTGYIRKMRYYYNPLLVEQSTYMEMHLKVIQTNPSFDTNTFSERRFVTKTSKGFKGVGNYQSYTVQGN